MDYIDTLTLDQVNELMGYWSEQPPTHIVLGPRHEPKRKPKANAAEEANDLSAMFGVAAEKMPEHYAQAVEWAEDVQKKISKGKPS